MIDKNRTTLVVIELKRGIALQPKKPYSSPVVIRNASLLLTAFRQKRMPAFLVHAVNTKVTMF